MRHSHSFSRRLAEAVASKKKAAFDDLCFDIEHEQLGRVQWPDDVFEFFVEALHNPAICSLSGSRSFILTLYNDFAKLTPSQREALLVELDKDADSFEDEMFRHSASDLIARLYPVPIALRIFDRWARAATPKRLHMAQVGFEVLLMSKTLSRADEADVRGKLKTLRQGGRETP